MLHTPLELPSNVETGCTGGDGGQPRGEEVGSNGINGGQGGEAVSNGGEQSRGEGVVTNFIAPAVEAGSNGMNGSQGGEAVSNGGEQSLLLLLL